MQGAICVCALDDFTKQRNGFRQHSRASGKCLKNRGFNGLKEKMTSHMIIYLNFFNAILWLFAAFAPPYALDEFNGF